MNTNNNPVYNVNFNNAITDVVKLNGEVVWKRWQSDITIPAYDETLFNFLPLKYADDSTTYTKVTDAEAEFYGIGDNSSTAGNGFISNPLSSLLENQIEIDFDTSNLYYSGPNINGQTISAVPMVGNSVFTYSTDTSVVKNTALHFEIGIYVYQFLNDGTSIMQLGAGQTSFSFSVNDFTKPFDSTSSFDNVRFVGSSAGSFNVILNNVNTIPPVGQIFNVITKIVSMKIIRQNNADSLPVIENLVIPPTHNGKPVKIILSNAFRYIPIKNIYLTENISDIFNYSFAGNTKLEYLYVGCNNPNTSGTDNAIFRGSGCDTGCTVEFGDSVNKISDALFCSAGINSVNAQDVFKVKTVKLNNVKNIGAVAFAFCTYLYDIDISRVNNIGQLAFACIGIECDETCKTEIKLNSVSNVAAGVWYGVENIKEKVWITKNCSTIENNIDNPLFNDTNIDVYTNATSLPTGWDSTLFNSNTITMHYGHTYSDFTTNILNS